MASVLDTTHISSLLDESSNFFTDDAWDRFFYSMAPQNIRDTPRVHSWADRRKADLVAIKAAITRLLTACHLPTPPYNNQTVALIAMNGSPTVYAHCKIEEDGTTTYHELWLDVSNRPHHTGRQIQSLTGYHVQPAQEWDPTPTERRQHDDGDPRYDDERPHCPPSIIGPDAEAFPRNVGWYMQGQTPLTANAEYRKLSDLTIHNITAHLTRQIIGDTVPNCIANWTSRVAGTPEIPWKKLFASFGTPISDPTEERQWQKLIHRAIFTHNRDASLDQRCRLCKCADESQLHLFQCRHTEGYWRACLYFTKQVLHALRPESETHALIFGVWKKNELGPEDARAFLRHAFGTFYRDFADVDMKQQKIIWQCTFHNALKSLESAVLRRARQIRLQYVNRKYSTLEKHVPPEELTRFTNLIGIDNTGVATATPPFVRAIADAAQAAKTARDAAAQRGN